MSQPPPEPIMNDKTMYTTVGLVFFLLGIAGLGVVAFSICWQASLGVVSLVLLLFAHTAMTMVRDNPKVEKEP
jgi:hypothetical protein